MHQIYPLRAQICLANVFLNDHRSSQWEGTGKQALKITMDVQETSIAPTMQPTSSRDFPSDLKPDFRLRDHQSHDFSKMNQGYIPIYHAHEVSREDVAVDQRSLAPKMWPVTGESPNMIVFHGPYRMVL